MIKKSIIFFMEGGGGGGCQYSFLGLNQNIEMNNPLPILYCACIFILKL